MKSFQRIPAISLTLAALLIAIVGCSSESKSDDHGLVAEVVDSVAAAVADNLAEIRTAQAASLERDDIRAAAMPVVGPPAPVTGMFDMNDMMVAGGKIYSVFDGGVVVYDLATKSQATIPIQENLQAVAEHQGTVYVGGDYLYVVGDGAVRRLDYEFEGVIQCLEGHDNALMIGTTAGLYSHSRLGREQLLQGIPVTALASESAALWVGTDGQGLYRWDGDEFRRRFLVRDETLFDSVLALDFAHDHLYVGSKNGLHVYNGGRWDNYGPDDGLPEGRLNSIDASAWVVYIGTETGVVSFYNGVLEPVEKLDTIAAQAVRSLSRQVLVATDREGILVKSGRMVRTLVAPEVDAGEEMVTLSQ
ncbi:MAG: hypothetical protein ABIE70_08110 [bacterium]